MGKTKERLIRRAEGAAGEAIHKAEETVNQLTLGDKDGATTEKNPDRSAPSNGLAGSKSQAA